MSGAALVTGAGVRIGRTIAEALGRDGFAVAVHYRGSADAAEDTAAAIRASGGRAATVQGDLGDPADVDTLVARAAEALGTPLTCLVNNASVFEDDRAGTVTRETWTLHMDANLYAPLMLAQAFAAQLPETAEGNIVNIIDQRVWALTPKFLSYTLSKAGLWTLTQTLAQALSPRIRVNGIGPGPTLRNARQSEEDFAAQVEGVLLKRATDPEEIANAVRFLIATPSLTGQMLALDGGQHLGWETPDVKDVTE
ncbi:SDR family oxidoreductase [Futiania mangrovi]|uniref:SDR family oxidoreductase n=1 Tax=Futiania mangrovi TaxID=2959716 RepID=A0A9J6PFD6_9PROT|nr:SDR family oxidoreductase [Futiania mangrovii]MCP1337433.1 SDR family oxidoreductase [Futiania mangrovii]